MQCKDIYNFLEKPPDQMFRIKQVSTVCFLCFCWGIIRRVISTEQKKRRDFEFFVDQATPGFELGKKGFAVLCLTTRPCRQNATNTK